MMLKRLIDFLMRREPEHELFTTHTACLRPEYRPDAKINPEGMRIKNF